jgi:hypothetical protein
MKMSLRLNGICRKDWAKFFDEEATQLIELLFEEAQPAIRNQAVLLKLVRAARREFAIHMPARSRPFGSVLCHHFGAACPKLPWIGPGGSTLQMAIRD